ncbi:MAG: FAD-binding oxidoreductase [Pseudolabrys sp.]|nr:FAD-binding oxidoreductase [Pseudolabrys sp.]
MSETARVAIVGGGLAGCMTAYYLGRRGCPALVLERGVVGGQSSGVSFGSLRLQGQHGPGLDLALAAQAIWEGIERELGAPVGFVQHGHVHLALDDAHIRRLEANAVASRAAGLSPALLDGGEARRRWPFLSVHVRGASFSARDGVVNPRLVAPAFARAARALGARIHEHTEVIEATASGEGFELKARRPDGTRLAARAEVLVNAAGAWAGRFAAAFGEAIPCFAAGPAEMVTEPIPHFVAPVMHVVDGSVLFRQTARGNVVIGGHPRMTVDAQSRQLRVPTEKILTNLARLTRVAPHLGAYSVIRSWTGVEGYLPDMMPVVGASETTPGLFHACAFSGHGLQLGPAVGMALAGLITTGRTQVPIAPFSIARLRAGLAAVPTLAEEFQGGTAGAG